MQMSFVIHTCANPKLLAMIGPMDSFPRRWQAGGVPHWRSGVAHLFGQVQGWTAYHREIGPAPQASSDWGRKTGMDKATSWKRVTSDSRWVIQEGSSLTYEGIGVG